MSEFKEGIDLKEDECDCFFITQQKHAEKTGFIIIEPDESVIDINVNSAQLEQLGYSVSGDYYPCEISYDEYTFVIDDDWSIFVSAENQTEKNLYLIRDYIKRLANIIYIRR